MDNKKKIIIVLGIIGLVLTCGGAVMGGNPSSISTMFSETSLPEGAQNTQDVKTADVHAIELNLVNSNISIKLGKHFDLSGTGVFNSYIKDGVYYAGANDSKCFTNLFGAKIGVPSKWICGYGSYVLTVPSKATLDNITINTFHCNIAADTLQAANLNIKMVAGNLTINHLATETLSVDIRGGKASVTNPAVSGSGNIHVSGDISMGDTNAMESSIKSVSMSSSWGDISLVGQIAGNLHLQTGLGNITATLPGSSKNYRLTAQKGDLLISPTAGVENSSEHFADLFFTCKHGNASVNFK